MFQFETTTLSVPYRNEEKREYQFRFRHGLPVVMGVVEDKAFKGKLHLHPERRYVRKSDGTGNMRVYHEANSADDWWDVQVRIHIVRR